MNPTPALTCHRSTVVEDGADVLGIALGYVGYGLWLAVVAPLAFVWCMGLNCSGWVLDKARGQDALLPVPIHPPLGEHEVNSDPRSERVE